MPGKRYWRDLDHGLHLGYRRGANGGRWLARFYLGGGRYAVETLAVADDNSDADESLTPDQIGALVSNGANPVLSFYQVQAAARARAITRMRGRPGIFEAGTYTVRRAMEEYLFYLDAEAKPSAAADAKYRAEAFILPEFGDVQVATLTSNKIDQWKQGLATTPARLRTKKGEDQQHRAPPADDEAVRRRRVSANRCLSILKAGLNWALQNSEGLKGSGVTDHEWRIVKKFKHVEVARGDHLEPAQVKRLVNACGPDLRALVLAALYTGARYGSLIKLRVDDYKAPLGQVQLRGTKTGKDFHVYLNDEGRAFFDRLTSGRGPDEIMLSREVKGRSGETRREPWGQAHHQRPFRDAVKRAKLPQATTFYTLRHTYASLALMNGAPPMVVAHNLGHSDTRMVEAHYGHLTKKYVEDQIKAAAPSFGIVEADNVERMEAGR
jgi:integrase